MATLNAGTVLTPEERLARRRLILRDAASLLTLFLITVVIFLLTLLLYRSFQNHRQVLGLRWKGRGEAALRAGNSIQAIDALRSALAYLPDDRQTEIDLAMALAQAGKTVEATAYFNTLLESAPGDGTINLELARLAAKRGNERLAVQRYHAALDGTWEGNGYDRRREVRLELARYLLSRKEYTSARTQLLIAASNAPEDPSIKDEIAGLLEQAQDPTDALGLYRTVAARRDAPLAAFEGAGRSAFNLGLYRVVNAYLTRALGHPGATALPPPETAGDQYMLKTASHILLLFPALDLAPRSRAERILYIRKVARLRLSACAASNSSAAPKVAPIVGRWDQLPADLTLSQLEQQPDLENSILQLAWDTETATAQICGQPGGDDALLLRIAQNPEAVEQE
ncbi:MAG TPA: tetratricopeptide repeat protein [Acidobacteriaceae bacterium]|jgi:tetratricopeptide (TPR) repeat protein|nr:tetratricopeptide repeat protein [Acidobacteriaceae bacterium]